MYDTLPYLQPTDFPAITRKKVAILQLNLGYLCNLSCTHCHVNAGPKRTELMSEATLDLVFAFAIQHNIKVFDLTGGAPEMNPLFKELIKRASELKIKILNRCNLVILQEPEYAKLADFLAHYNVEIIASLPCYLAENVDKQRGKGVFEQSILALQKLNALGYAQPKSELKLHLVFNPQGAVLPPAQVELESHYKQQLFTQFGIVFNQLWVMANVPIQRFGSQLISHGQFKDYLQLLKAHYQVENLALLMCKTTLSVDWQGFVYDCDFNQMLNLPLAHKEKALTHLSQLMEVDFLHQPIATLEHCYACAAGQGSSCGGALSSLNP